MDIKVPLPEEGRNNLEDIAFRHDSSHQPQNGLPAQPLVIDKRRDYSGESIPFNAIPIGDNIVVKRIPEEEGLIVEADIAKDKPIKCEVVAVSCHPSSSLAYNALSSLRVGDKILIRRYSGTEVKVDGIEYTLVIIFDVLLKLQPSAPNPNPIGETGQMKGDLPSS